MLIISCVLIVLYPCPVQSTVYYNAIYTLHYIKYTLYILIHSTAVLLVITSACAGAGTRTRSGSNSDASHSPLNTSV